MLNVLITQKVIVKLPIKFAVRKIRRLTLYFGFNIFIAKAEVTARGISGINLATTKK